MFCIIHLGTSLEVLACLLIFESIFDVKLLKDKFSLLNQSVALQNNEVKGFDSILNFSLYLFYFIFIYLFFNWIIAPYV